MTCPDPIWRTLVCQQVQTRRPPLDIRIKDAGDLGIRDLPLIICLSDLKCSVTSCLPSAFVLEKYSNIFLLPVPDSLQLSYPVPKLFLHEFLIMEFSVERRPSYVHFFILCYAQTLISKILCAFTCLCFLQAVLSAAALATIFQLIRQQVEELYWPSRLDWHQEELIYIQVVSWP